MRVFDTKWDGVLLSMMPTPSENILESMYQTSCEIRNNQRRPVALHNQDTLKKNEPASYSRLKNMVKKYVDQKTKDRNFMPEMAGRRVELQSDKQVMTEVKAKAGNKGIEISGWLKDSAPKETHAVSNMT